MNMIKNISAAAVVAALTLAASSSAYAGCYGYYGW